MRSTSSALLIWGVVGVACGAIQHSDVHQVLALGTGLSSLRVTRVSRQDARVSYFPTQIHWVDGSGHIANGPQLLESANQMVIVSGRISVLASPADLEKLVERSRKALARETEARPQRVRQARFWQYHNDEVIWSAENATASLERIPVQWVARAGRVPDQIVTVAALSWSSDVGGVPARIKLSFGDVLQELESKFGATTPLADIAFRQWIGEAVEAGLIGLKDMSGHPLEPSGQVVDELAVLISHRLLEVDRPLRIEEASDRWQLGYKLRQEPIGTPDILDIDFSNRLPVDRWDIITSQLHVRP